LDFFEEEQHPILYGMILVLVATCIRNQEFCQLKVSDVKYDSILGNYYLDVLGKGNKRRTVPLKEKVLESIQCFREVRGLKFEINGNDHSPLFTTSTSAPPTFF
jgi:integrase/recombinase XerD